jgi:hypothetical protein
MFYWIALQAAFIGVLCVRWYLERREQQLLQAIRTITLDTATTPILRPIPIKVDIVCNPTSGFGGGRKVAAALAERLRRIGVHVAVEVHLTTHPGHAAAIVGGMECTGQISVDVGGRGDTNNRRCGGEGDPQEEGQEGWGEEVPAVAPPYKANQVHYVMEPVSSAASPTTTTTTNTTLPSSSRPPPPLRVLVLIGGDGSLSEALNAACDRPDASRFLAETVLALVPTGTGNGMGK